MIKDYHEQAIFDPKPAAKPQGPVECLGIIFEDDEKRRKYFLEKLREKLKDPEFRKIEGFPIGEDEDILALSDPPYYTACPNPFIEDFIKQYGKPYDPNENYSCDPLASDVSKGKNEPIYNVHSYPTKVPPGAIRPLIEHFCNPGDVVYDPFCGTGMTGIAVCGAISDSTVILQDLAPSATHIAWAIQQREIDSTCFLDAASGILDSVYNECGWMYSTIIGQKEKEVRYFIWSDIYTCDTCGADIRIWDIEGKSSVGGFKEKHPCAECGSETSKQTMEPKHETVYDYTLQETIQRIKSVPVMKVVVEGNRTHKLPVDETDLKVLNSINAQPIPYEARTAKMLFKDGRWGDQWRSSYHAGDTHTHHIYTHRNYWILCAIWQRLSQLQDSTLKLLLRFWFTASLSRTTRLNRYMKQHNRHVGPLAGTLFIGPIQAEISPFYFFRAKITDIASALGGVVVATRGTQVVSTGSSTTIGMPDSSVDFIFADPPFGDNLMYSELNFLLETWLKIFTNQLEEAVISITQEKNLGRFETIIKRVFAECSRVLKPGKWMVVEFHNSRNVVWTAIQESIGAAGLVVADVRTLDKKKGTTKQLTQARTVKQDLIISAYKPNGGMEERFKLEAGTEDGVWDFVRMHLKQLPVFVSKYGQAEIIAERQNYLLFDRMLAFHVQRGVTVPLSAAEFYSELAQRFPESDGMYFLPEQVVEYDKKRMTVREVLQFQLFVYDEASAIQWLKQQLIKKPQTFQELHPQFLKEIGGWQKYEKPLELSELLEQNYLRYTGIEDVPSQIHSYISSNFKELRNLSKDDGSLRYKAKDRWYVPNPNKASDLEKLRERALLKEFWKYLPAGYKPTKLESQEGYIPGLELKSAQVPKGKKIKVIRLEAVRAGFKLCWQNRDYSTIIAVAQRIPESVLQEDTKLLMWYDQALTRLGEDA